MIASLRDALKTALKARDRVAISALRSALSAIENAEAVPVEDSSLPLTGNEHFAGATAGLGAAEAVRKELTEADVLAIVAKEARDRTTAAEEYEQLGRADEAARLRAEAEVLAKYLAK
ncbi:GatB/YqeY domain-containing protein [Lentzea tibetensis]|uniref:GatB/YqeY domain-containing protein n=1 Tax=Lentzea tibetensis TaxID=2591470 RepID=UPI001C994640|nr:GatB/YqeY domain-containing protein [Lentzea tibetensis]